MATYTIFVLDESDLTVSLPQGLDGQSQGDGSHLNGQTLTIDAPNWIPIEIRDNDLNFSDNDSSQELDGAQSLGGVSFADGSRLEAEFSFEAEFGGETWTLIAFNIREANSPYNNSFGSIEGIAVIGGPGGFPPPGELLQLSGASEGPNFAAADYATPICFDAGSLIRTPGGHRPVETLQVGDLVETLDDGPQPIRWIGSRRVFGIGPMAPVEIAAGALGNTAPVRLSQQHRCLVHGPRAELFFGGTEVLVAARQLLGRPGIRLAPGRRMHYHHLLLERHAVLDCAGLRAESFLPSDFGLSQLSAAARADLMPILAELGPAAAVSARPVLRAHEAALLNAAA
ncbi:MAG: Hint domain-containing protein [Pseudomonadota bacterium]